MRKRAICYLAAAALAVAMVVPGSAMAAGIQQVDAGFSPKKSDSISEPPPVANLKGKNSKNGTLRTHLHLESGTPVLPSTGIIDIHAPAELKFDTKRLDRCDPADITGVNEQAALDACDTKKTDALIGEGSAQAAVATTGTPLDPGKVLLFNGTKQNGNNTVLFYSTFPIPGLVIISEMRNSNLPGFGTVFHALVATSFGGPVPDGTPIVDTDFTNSKKWTDKKLKKKSKKLKKKSRKTKKKAKKASGKKKKRLKKKSRKLKKKSRKKKKKSKRSWVVGKCTDGELVTQVDWTHVPPFGPQSDTATQACTS